MQYTIQTLLKQACITLKQSYIEDATREAHYLLCAVLACERSTLIAWPEKQIDHHPAAQFLALVERRAAGEPTAYLLGRREFWGLNLAITPDVLIPRPDTETLVETVLMRIPKQVCWRILELGTGSGAIALALKHERPDCEIIATDMSPAALAVAQSNATRLDLDVQFMLSDWFTALTSAGCFHVIVSNPPYLAADDPHLQQTSLPFEPQLALVAKDNGMAAYTQIVAQSADFLYENGYLYVEHGYNQAAAMLHLFQMHQWWNIDQHTDINDIVRVTGGQRI